MLKRIIINFVTSFLIFSLIFGIGIEDVNAETFIIDNDVGCADYSGCNPIPNNDSNPKYMSDRTTVAYCSDHDLKFYGKTMKGQTVVGAVVVSNSNRYNYVKDDVFNDAKNCYYKDSSGGHNDGDCSEIIGYIIAEGNSYYRKKFNVSSVTIPVWYWTQVTVWAYLYEFNTSLRDTNDAAKGFYNDWSDIRTVIGKAWTSYSNNNTTSIMNSNSVNFTISSGDNNFYYVPKIESNSCSVSGEYKTQKRTITNNEGRNISVTLSAEAIGTNDDITIYYKTSKMKKFKIYDNNSKQIPKGDSMEVYLSSKYDISGNVKLDVRGSYFKRIEGTRYDSVRWKLPQYSGSAQGMFTLKSYNGTIDVENSQTRSVTFNKQGLNRKECGSNNKNMAGNDSANPVKKECAVDVNDDENKYRAKFQGCTCLGLDLGNNKYVNVLVKESSVFQFGRLIPNEKLYSGGGFSFDTIGIPTSYNSVVTWEYKDWKNNIPYYYNGNDLVDTDARNVESLIDEAVKNKIKNNLELKFLTLDSNDYKETKNVEIPLNLSINVDSSNFKEMSIGKSVVRGIAFDSNKAIELNKAYFSVDGSVSYVKDDIYSIDGGNKYYIPMGYTKDKFPFNIGRVNMSVVEGINFWYEATCGKEVEELYNKNLYYRSIDVKNPFPKAGNDSSKVPENWRKWYCGEGNICITNNNQNRMNNTYQMYPNSTPLYMITLNQENKEKLKRLKMHDGIESSYFDWDGINTNGTSKVVSSDIFKRNDTNSYCPIGKFIKECDSH